MVWFQIRNVWFGSTRQNLEWFGFSFVWFVTLEIRFGSIFIESEMVWFGLVTV
jgi:hypothetical protein